MLALTDAIVYTGDAVLPGAAVLVADGVIQAVTTPAALPAAVARRSLDGMVLAPGFIDVQVNGGGGALFNDDPSVDTIRRIGAAHRRFGTTGFLPTLISDAFAVRQAAVAAVRAAMAERVPGVLGIHLEGPHFNPVRRGVHAARWLGLPDEADLALIANAGAGVTVATVAPEVAGIEAIGRLAALGVRVCAGHTAAPYETVRSALAIGLTGFTHLFNAMAPLAGRDPGCVGAALEDERSWCGLILDGHHLHDAMVRLALRAKPGRRLILVTDAMPPVGSSPGESFTLNGETILVQDGACVTADGRLAGSMLDMAGAVRYAVRRIGVPLAEALRMAATYPAEFLGLGHRHGRIATGYAADLVVLDDDLRVRETWIAGACDNDPATVPIDGRRTAPRAGDLR